MNEELRPSPDDVEHPDEFVRWYWPVDLLHVFCDRLGLSKSGSKATLRSRVHEALGGPPAPDVPARPRGSWSRRALTLDTVITEDITFGPKVRGFFTEQIGSQFVCHGDFMAWVRSSPGLTLGDAVEAWRALEARKDDPEFRREIAACNNYLRYLRDLRDAHPELSQAEAKACWDQKKRRPAQDGVVVFEPEDLRFLDF